MKKAKGNSKEASWINKQLKKEVKLGVPIPEPKQKEETE
jgi:hypothetical protein